jgi:serine phosphatase RsbU (regulator of sigma subunit)
VRQVDAVSAGAFREPVVVSGPPEFVAIGQSVERMRQKILAELDEVERSNEALALEGPVVNALREELGASPFVPRGTVEVAGRLLAAEGVLAGDFYDVRWLADGSLAIVVADVAGHGYEAGLLALRFKILVEAALAQDSDPGRCLTWAAARLGETESMFLTCALAILDVNERRLLFASAGHPAGVLLPSDGSLAALESTGPVIGPFSGCWQNSVVELDPGEAALVLCSDGLFEARSGAGVLFGFERAADLIRSEDTAEDIVDTCCAAARDHAAVRLRDDLTIVAVRLR